MPRSVQYPRASLAQALELAASVEHLGGECTLAAAAELTGHSAGGTYAALVAATVKYGWITARKGRLRTTPAFADYRLAGDEPTRRAALATALTCPPLFARLAQRFAGKPLPEGSLARLLVREFGVPEGMAPRIAGYFVSGARAAGLLEGAELRHGGAATSTPPAVATRDHGRANPAPGMESGAGPAGRREARPVAFDEVSGLRDDAGESTAPAAPASPRALQPSTGYSLVLRGPGVDATLQLSDAADVGLARALLERVARALDTRDGRSVDE